MFQIQMAGNFSLYTIQTWGADFWPLQPTQLLLRNKRILLQPAIHPQAQETEHSKLADNGIIKNLITSLSVTLILLMWRIVWAPNSIPIYIQQDAMLHSLFISGNCSMCFGWYFHPSSGVYTIVSTASDICHTFTAICRYRGRVGTGLSVLWVA
jgi:hypothetical protein